MPTPSIDLALVNYVDNRAEHNRKLTLERVDSVMPDGSVMVRGARLPVAGRVALQAGVMVPVAWRDGRMDVVLYGTGRRTGVASSEVPEVALAVAEELFSEPAMFRDQHNFVEVDIAAAKAAAGITTDVTLRWGIGDPSFVVMRGSNGDLDLILAVCRINRPQREQAFQLVKGVKLVLVRAYNLSTLGHSFGTSTVHHTFASGATITLPVSYVGSAFSTDQMPAGGSFEVANLIPAAAVAPNGDLLVIVRVEVNASSTSFATDLRMEAGSKIVNVTKNKVVANRLASTLQAAFLVPLGNVQYSTDAGVGLAESGNILAMLSLKEANPTKDGDANNYAMESPAYILGLPRPAISLRIEGQYAQKVQTLAGGDVAVAETARVQGSRTALVWGIVKASALTGIRIADLPHAKVSVLAGDPDMMFSSSFPAPLPFTADSPASRALFLGRDDLVYSPRDLTAPFTRQFYWAGHSSGGAFTINLGRKNARSDLQQVAKRTAPKNDTQRSAILNGGGDLQVFQPAIGGA